jgi:hypothetical protein
VAERRGTAADLPALKPVCFESTCTRGTPERVSSRSVGMAQGTRGHPSQPHGVLNILALTTIRATRTPSSCR